MHLAACTEAGKSQFITTCHEQHACTQGGQVALTFTACSALQHISGQDVLWHDRARKLDM